MKTIPEIIKYLEDNFNTKGRPLDKEPLIIIDHLSLIMDRGLSMDELTTFIPKTSYPAKSDLNGYLKELKKDYSLTIIINESPFNNDGK
jgi:hypothetical protein